MTTGSTLRKTSPGSNTVNMDNPWPGLLAYREADEKFFHGRQRESDELRRLVLREPLTILFSSSGLGKSSLLQAGVFPRLRHENILPIYIRLGFSPDLPSLTAQVKHAIASESASTGAEAPAGKEGETLWEYFHRQNADFWSQRNRLLLPLLVFDQFEEIFTLGRSDPALANASEEFLTELGDLIEGRPPASLKENLDAKPEYVSNFTFGRHQYKVLLSLREDFLPELEGLRERIPSVAHNRMRLQRMNGTSAFEVVSHARHLISPEVAEKVVRFVAAAEHSDMAMGKLELEPALLSVVCRELNNKRQQRNEPGITQDLLEGSRQEILSGFYERSVADLVPEVSVFVEDQLLTVSGYRDSVALENALSIPGVTREAIDRLVDRRLIRREERPGMQRLELTHDLLTGVIATSRDNRRRLEAEKQRERERAEIERQKRLEEEARISRIRKKFNWAAGAAAVILLVSLVTVWKQKQVSDKWKNLALSRQLAAQSAGNLAHRIDRALLLSVVALRVEPSFEARDGVLRALQQAPPNFLWGHNKGVNSVAFSPDGKTLASGSSDKSVILWDVTSRKPIGEPLKGHQGDVLSVAFSNDGKTLASGNTNNSVILWDVARRQPIGEPLKGHRNRVESVAFSYDGKILASGSSDKNIILWDVASRKPIGKPLEGGQGVVESVAFSPDGTTLASGSIFGSVILWDVESRQPIGKPLERHKSSVESVAFSPDGKTMATGSYDKSVILWDVASRQPIGKPLEAHQGEVYGVAFSHDGKTLASGSSDNSVILWDVASRKPIGKPFRGHQSDVLSVAFSNDGKTLASGSWDGSVYLWDVTRRQPIVNSLPGHRDNVNCIAFSNDGITLASGSSDNSVILWDVASRQPIGEPLKGHRGKVSSIAFSPDGKTLASGSHDKSVILWDVASRQPIGKPLEAHQGEVNSLAFSPDGKTLASGSWDGRIILWNKANRQPIGEPLMGNQSEVLSVAFSPDGKTLASGYFTGNVILWDVASRKPNDKVLKGDQSSVYSVAFSPDGKILASGSYQGSVFLWDVVKRQQISEPLKGHWKAVRSIAFSPDGKTLASGNTNNSVILWDVARRQPIGEPLKGHRDYVYSVVFSPDGKTLASGSGDGNVFLWDVEIASWEKIACKTANRNLTHEEWNNYVGETLDYEPVCPN